ncbi:MAG TPA: hypothetical protein VKT49_12275 [Bryobacteraceae bacterium]|nr:hypothetical protein [Bryobacteraceae bacterium]
MKFLTISVALAGVAAYLSAGTGKPDVLRVVNAASFESIIASSAWISIFGTNLSLTPRTWAESDITDNRLPTALDGVSEINGSLGYLSYISPTQVNVLVPDDPAEGIVAVLVSTPQGRSEPFAVKKQSRAPAFFSLDAEQYRYLAAVHADGAVAAKRNLYDAVRAWPASPGDPILLFGTGLGPTDPPHPASTMLRAPAPLAAPSSASIGGLPLGISSAALVLPGLYQINVTIPELPDGDHSVVLETAGYRTPERALSVQGRLIADHTSTDLARIPDYWLEQARQNIRMYFAHTSHGTQITSGLQRLHSQLGARYRVALGETLPSVGGALNILDNGSIYDWNPDFLSGVDRVLAANPSVNVVMYIWCGQPAKPDWKALFDEYVNGMQALEQRYRRVTFVYATGNAQEQDCPGCLRQKFNEELRKFAKQNNKVLFDFGDLDTWYEGRQNSYATPNWCSAYGCTPGLSVPSEHPQWGGGNYNNPCGHASYLSCDNKAKAMWWLLSRLAGWDGTSSTPPAR